MIADISHHDGDIDWDVARTELDMVIFRSSIGLKPDTRYAEYANACGIPFGVYHYIKAGNASEAKKEARYFFEKANVPSEKPLFYVGDIEHETQTRETTEEVCRAFLEEMRALGCKKVGLYIGQKRYAYAGDAIKLYDFIWIPNWGKDDGTVPDKGPKYPCDLWQYTSKGLLSGVNEYVDLNVLHGNKGLDWFTGDKKGGNTMFTNKQ